MSTSLERGGAPLFRVERLHAAYGGARILTGLDIAVGEGELVLLLGPNGAGKTTLLRSIAGVGPRVTGSILLGDRQLLGLKSHEVVKAGVAMVPEGRRVFPDLTVLENLYMGGYTTLGRPEHQTTLQEVLRLFPRLRERAGQKAGTLSGGEAQMLAVARAIMSRPRLLMLDEPSLGLAPLLVQEVFAYAQRLAHERGLAVLLAEQAASAALRVADRGYVLGQGHVLIAGTAAELASDDQVKDVYLGSPVAP